MHGMLLSSPRRVLDPRRSSVEPQFSGRRQAVLMRRTVPLLFGEGMLDDAGRIHLPL